MVLGVGLAVATATLSAKAAQYLIENMMFGVMRMGMIMVIQIDPRQRSVVLPEVNEDDLLKIVAELCDFKQIQTVGGRNSK